LLLLGRQIQQEAAYRQIRCELLWSTDW